MYPSPAGWPGTAPSDNKGLGGHKGPCTPMRLAHGCHALPAVYLSLGRPTLRIHQHEDRQMTKTVGQNEQEMRDILAEAVEAKQEWALRLVERHGSVEAAVG